MKKNIFFGFVLVFFIGVISLISVIAYKGSNVNGLNYNEEVHEQLKAAIESGDYDAWIRIRRENNLPMNGRIFQVINADNFDKYRELHNAIQSGDYEKANLIRAELGLGQGVMKKGHQNNTKQLKMNGQRINKRS